MANYYTNEVITDAVYLTDDLCKLLQMKGAEVEPTGEKQTVLDGMVNGAILNQYYVTFENGWNEYYETFDEWAAEELYDDDEVAEVSDYIKAHFGYGKEDLLHEVLKVNPEMDHIVMQAAWSCSKMRLDGFGGSGLIVNRKGYLYLTTSNYVIDEDGTIRNASQFTTWESEQEARDEAA